MKISYKSGKLDGLYVLRLGIFSVHWHTYKDKEAIEGVYYRTDLAFQVLYRDRYYCISLEFNTGDRITYD